MLPHIPIGGRVLDACCGTGQLAAELRERGYRVVGLDRSHEMLRYGWRRSPGVAWLQADVRTCALRPTLDAVTCMFDSLNHMLSVADLQRALTGLRGVLRPGGILVFDVNTDEGFRQRWVREWEVSTPDGLCRLVGEYDQGRRTGSYRFRLQGRGADAWRCADFEFQERCHSDAELRESLARAGFAVLEVCDAVADFGMDEEVGRSFYVAEAR